MRQRRYRNRGRDARGYSSRISYAGIECGADDVRALSRNRGGDIVIRGLFLADLGPV